MLVNDCGAAAPLAAADLLVAMDKRVLDVAAKLPMWSAVVEHHIPGLNMYAPSSQISTQGVAACAHDVICT